MVLQHAIMHAMYSNVKIIIVELKLTVHSYLIFLSCSDWDTASHFCSSILPINGFLLGLSQMRTSLVRTR